MVVNVDGRVERMIREITDILRELEPDYRQMNEYRLEAAVRRHLHAALRDHFHTIYRNLPENKDSSAPQARQAVAGR